MTNEPILLPVAPHSGGYEFPETEKYRGIVEQALSDRLGRPVFFEEAVDMVMGRIAGRIEEKSLQVTAKSESTSCAFAPQLRGIRELAEREARKLGKEIEERFVRTGKLLAL
jgi:hypothetical protein